jgi:hypothetical protein
MQSSEENLELVHLITARLDCFSLLFCVLIMFLIVAQAFS